MYSLLSWTHYIAEEEFELLTSPFFTGIPDVWHHPWHILVLRVQPRGSCVLGKISQPHRCLQTPDSESCYLTCRLEFHFKRKVKCTLAWWMWWLHCQLNRTCGVFFTRMTEVGPRKIKGGSGLNTNIPCSASDCRCKVRSYLTIPKLLPSSSSFAGYYYCHCRAGFPAFPK